MRQSISRLDESPNFSGKYDLMFRLDKLVNFYDLMSPPIRLDETHVLTSQPSTPGNKCERKADLQVREADVRHALVVPVYHSGRRVQGLERVSGLGVRVVVPVYHSDRRVQGLNFGCGVKGLGLSYPYITLFRVKGLEFWV